MNFLIVTNVQHYAFKNSLFGYAPYVREMNIWIKNAHKVTIVAPICKSLPSVIDVAYIHNNIDFKAVKTFNFLGLFASLKALFIIPKIFLILIKAMYHADHIHLRCPGNIGFLGCIAQIFFPAKTKTVKYAGNWDYKAKKPLTYRLQQWIVSSTFLAKNMTVLVYGVWQKSSKNIKSFFTATYSKNEIVTVPNRNTNGTIKFIFVGMLVSGKNPFYAIQIIEKLRKNGFDVSLELYGDGNLKEALTAYIIDQKIEKIVFLKGNQKRGFLKKKYQDSHFMILPSESEGWPKAVAEAMFWGCIPISTNVSCVPQMIENDQRGILLALNLEADFEALKNIMLDYKKVSEMRFNAKNWSQNFTLEKFETEIKKLLI